MSTTNVTSLFIQPGTLNVGIGTSQPRAKLEVAGSIVPSSNVVYDLGSATLRWRDLYLSGNSINLGGTTISRDATTGGIKFIDPATNQPLDSTVRNLTASNLTVLGDYVTLNTVTSNTEQMVIQNAGTGPALKVTQTGANSIAEFYDDGNALALKIADGGNVGIGTNSPQKKLDIIGNVSINGGIGVATTGLLVVRQSGDTQNDGIALTSSFGTSHRIYKNTVGDLTIARTSQTDMILSSTGNVGIGTATPNTLLHINGVLTMKSYYVFVQDTTTTFTSWFAFGNNPKINDNSVFNSSTLRYTAPVKGIYIFAFHGFTISDSHVGLAYNAEYVDNNNYPDANGVQLWNITAGTTGMSPTWILKLNKNDFIRCIIYANGTLSSSRSYFYGTLMHAVE